MPTLRGNLPLSQESEKRPQSERNLTHKARDLKRYPQEHLVYPHIINILIHRLSKDMLPSAVCLSSRASCPKIRARMAYG